MKKKLPVKVQTKVNNLMCNAAYLCIILAYDNTLPWFYEHYIQLYLARDKNRRMTDERELFLDFYGGWIDPREILKMDRLYRRDVIDYNIEEIKSIIKEGSYIYTYVDEFYTLDIDEHNCHDIFVYGYDDETQMLDVIGYQDAYFTSYQIKYDAFIKGYRSGAKISEQFDTYDGANFIIKITPLFTKETVFEFHMDNFMMWMKEFIESTHSGILHKSEIEYFTYQLYEYETNIYGLATLESITEEIELHYELDGPIDYRAFHTLYEHNVIMKERLEYIYTEVLKIEQKEVDIKAIDSLVSLSNKIRLDVLKYYFDQDIDLLDEIMMQTKELCELERKTYIHIYEELRSVI